MKLRVQIPGQAAAGLTVSASVLLQAQEAMAMGASRRRVGLVVLGLALAHERVSLAVVDRGWVGAAPVALDVLCALLDGDPAGVQVYADAVAVACETPIRFAPAPVAVADPPSAAGPFGAIKPDQKEEIIKAALAGG